MTDPITTPEQMREAAAQVADCMEQMAKANITSNGAVAGADLVRDAAKAIAAAIRAIPIAPQPVAVTVKPLVWVEIRSGQYLEARVIGILYSVRLGSDGVVRWQAGFMGIWIEVPSIEAAKAAAQADYEARILSAIEATPARDVRALMKALRDADSYIAKGHYEMARNITRNALAMIDKDGGEWKLTPCSP